jgi:hypothetical protein
MFKAQQHDCCHFVIACTNDIRDSSYHASVLGFNKDVFSQLEECVLLLLYYSFTSQHKVYLFSVIEFGKAGGHCVYQTLSE